MKLERDTFGLVLRAGRQRRNLSLSQLANETKVRPEVWVGLEENNLAAWPKGIYARSLIRQYAERVDLDPDHLVSEFCRLFPQGDRRGETVLREYAAIVAHQLEYRDDAAPRYGRRRGDRCAHTPAWRQQLRTALGDWMRQRVRLSGPRSLTHRWATVRQSTSIE